MENKILMMKDIINQYTNLEKKKDSEIKKYLHNDRRDINTLIDKIQKINEDQDRLLDDIDSVKNKK